jgi:hypothetical protein
MHLDFDDSGVISPQSNQFYKLKMNEKEFKMISEELKNIDDRVALDYTNSGLMFELSQGILQKLIDEIIDDCKELELEKCFVGNEEP